MFFNRFLYALGIGAFAWGLFSLLGWFLDALANFLSTFARWYRYAAVPYAWEMAVAAGIAYLLIAGFMSSRNGN